MLPLRVNPRAVKIRMENWISSGEFRFRDRYDSRRSVEFFEPLLVGNITILLDLSDTCLRFFTFVISRFILLI